MNISDMNDSLNISVHYPIVTLNDMKMQKYQQLLDK